MVHTNLMAPVLNRWTNAAHDPSLYFSPFTPGLSRSLRRATQRTSPWEAQVKAIQPPATLGVLAPGMVIPHSTGSDSPKKVAEWASPTEPDMMIQVWCLQASAEPVCFTLENSPGS